MSQRYGIIFFAHMWDPSFVREVRTARTHLGAKRIALQMVRKYHPDSFLLEKPGALKRIAETYSHQFVDGSGFVIVQND